MQASTEIPDHVTLEHVNVSHSAKRVDGDDNGVVGMSPKYFKIILTTGLFLLTIAVSLIPLKFLALARRGPLRRRRRFRKVLSLLSCFAGKLRCNIVRIHSSHSKSDIGFDVGGW